MNLIDMTFEERYAMMRQRHAFLSETVRDYTSLEEYAKDKDEWFAIRGINLTMKDGCISLCNFLMCNDYEDYYVVPTADGHLAVSHVIWWQHPYCYNDVLNIFTEKSVDEEDILTSY